VDAIDASEVNKDRYGHMSSPSLKGPKDHR
jgi:hypothetical protein